MNGSKKSNSINEGVWQVNVVANETIWVIGREDIKIIRHVNSRQLLGILRNVIYIHDLARTSCLSGQPPSWDYISH